MLHYCINLSFALYSLQSQVRASLLQPAQTNNLWLLIRDLQRTSWKHKQWQGPFQVLLKIQTAVEVEGCVTSVHASYCKMIPAPQ